MSHPTDQLPVEPDMEEVELLPSERNEVVILWADIQRKYGEKPATGINIMQMVNEATTRFRELGFILYVDPSTLDITEKDEVVVSPTMYIIGRTNPKADGHDHERHTFETQSGLSDGVEGAMGRNGEFLDRPGRIF